MAGCQCRPVPFDSLKIETPKNGTQTTAAVETINGRFRGNVENGYVQTTFAWLYGYRWKIKTSYLAASA